MDEVFTFCRVCGKQLTDETSVAAGIGPVCVTRAALVGEQQARKEAATRDNVPENYVPLRDAVDVCRDHGIPISRLVYAIGGDKLWEAPISTEFFSVYVRGRRYLPKAVLGAIPAHLLNKTPKQLAIEFTKPDLEPEVVEETKPKRKRRSGAKTKTE